jgi:hypothetical protein
VVRPKPVTRRFGRSRAYRPWRPKRSVRRPTTLRGRTRTRPPPWARTGRPDAFQGPNRRELPPRPPPRAPQQAATAVGSPESAMGLGSHLGSLGPCQRRREARAWFRSTYTHPCRARSTHGGFIDVNEEALPASWCSGTQVNSPGFGPSPRPRRRGRYHLLTTVARVPERRLGATLLQDQPVVHDAGDVESVDRSSLGPSHWTRPSCQHESRPRVRALFITFRKNERGHWKPRWVSGIVQLSDVHAASSDSRLLYVMSRRQSPPSLRR